MLTSARVVINDTNVGNPSIFGNNQTLVSFLQELDVMTLQGSALGSF